MPPRYVLAGHKNLLFYLLIWFSFTISNWRTVQLDYDVPTTSTVKNTPSDLDGQFDSESNKNDFVIEKNKEIQRDFLNPTLDQRKQSKKRRPQKPSKYKASTIFGTSRKSFAFTPISGQSSTEKGNNKSPHNRNSSPSVLQVNASGYVKSHVQSNGKRNASENEFDQINNTSATTNKSLNNGSVTFNYDITNGNYGDYTNRSISHNRTNASLNDALNRTKINDSRDNITFTEEWIVTSDDKNNRNNGHANITTDKEYTSDKNSNKSALRNETRDNNSILRNESVIIQKSDDGTVNDSNQTLYNVTSTDQTVRNATVQENDKANETKYFTGGNNATRIKGREVSNHTEKNQINVNSSTTETPILKTVGIEHSTIKESANIAASVDQTIDSPETQTESKKNKSSKNILTTLVSATKNPETNTKTDTPLNGHLEIATPPVSNENAEYRSDEPRRKESEFIPDLATETSNNQQASNRLNPSQPRHETLETRKPDLHLLTPEPNAHNILITTDKNKETEILQGKNVKPNKDEVTLLKQLIQTTTSSHQKDTAINKINKRHVNPPEPTADDIEYTPFAAALSNDEVEEKYKTKSNVQPKSVRRKVLNDFGNDLRGLCADLSGTKDKGEVALADISLTTILTPFAGKSQNFFEICSLTNDSVTKIKNTFAIGRELEEKYKSWECDEKQPKCDGLCLGVTHLISHYVLDIFTNKRINRRQAYRSTIVNVLLINPKTWEIVKTEHLSTPVEYKLQLYSNEVEKDFELACCVWERNLWNKSACKTVQLHNDMIHCGCYSLGYTTAFLIEKGVTNTDIPKEMTKQLTDLNKNKNKKSSLVKYKFEIDADYNKTVGNDKKATEERFKEQIAKQLNLTKESIERVIIAPECDDCDVANDSSVQNFTQKVRNLYPSAPGSIKVVVQVKVDAKSNVSAADVHKHLQDKINNNELVLTDKNKNKLEINPDQNVGVEIEAIEAEDNSLTTAIILCVVIIVLLFFLVILGVAINKKLKKGREKILPFNKKLTPYLNPTYKSFHNENTLDGTIESLVRIRRRSDQFLYDFDKAVWDSGKGAGMNSHVIKPSCPSWSSSNSALRRHSQPPSLSSTIGSKQSMERRIVSPPMPGYVDDNSV